MAQWRKFSSQEFNSYLTGWAIVTTVMLTTLMIVAHLRV
jgi:hypothetical protein